MVGGYAWVTLATNDSYSLGALVLAHSLKQVGTGHQLAVLVTPGVTNAMREKLASVFNLVQEVNILDSKDETNLRLLKRPELGITFTKLHCWRLTQFDKCVFLDADALVLQNCDELFNREELSAAPDVGWPDCFNTGVFVYRPSNETYEKLVQFALEKGSFDGGDQGLLNLYFSDWATKDISRHLPFIYNLCSTACYSYLPAFKQFGLNAKIIHFIGSSKPWLQYFNTETRTVQPSEELKHLQGALQYWWNIFCSVIHPQLTKEMSGLAGAFAQLTLGAPRTAEQSALEDHLRRQGWETGNIDYMGRDSFDNIWNKICETLSAGLPTSPEETTETTSTPRHTDDEMPATEADLKLSEVPPSELTTPSQDSTISSSLAPLETPKSVSETAQDILLEQTKIIPEAKSIAEGVSPQAEVKSEIIASEKTADSTSETVIAEPAKETSPSKVQEAIPPAPAATAEDSLTTVTAQSSTAEPSVITTESLKGTVPSTQKVSSAPQETSPLTCTKVPQTSPPVVSSSPIAETPQPIVEPATSEPTAPQTKQSESPVKSSTVPVPETEPPVTPEVSTVAPVVESSVTLDSCVAPATVPESISPAPAVKKQVLAESTAAKKSATTESGTPASETKTPVTPESSTSTAAPPTKSKTRTEPTKPASKSKAEKTDSAAADSGASPTPPPRKAGIVKKTKAKK